MFNDSSLCIFSVCFSPLTFLAVSAHKKNHPEEEWKGGITGAADKTIVCGIKDRKDDRTGQDG